jgi:hypothetical protein
MINTINVISMAASVVDAAKRDLALHGDEQKKPILDKVETVFINLLPAVGDLWLLICAMDESENNHDDQMHKLHYHYQIGQEVLDEMQELLVG